MSEQTDYEIEKKLMQELLDKKESMASDRNKKLAMAKEQLVEQLKVTVDKYRTATGVMEALRVIRLVNGKDGDGYTNIEFELQDARDLAMFMVSVVSEMAHKADRLGYAEMDELCEGFYDEDLVSKQFSYRDLCLELMRIDLCRNVGPAAEDIVGFIEKTDAEIADVDKEIEAMLEDHPEFSTMKPAPKE